MTSRDKILAKVRSGVAAGAPVPFDEGERRATVEQRIAHHAGHLVPARASGKSAAERVEILRRWLELAGGELVQAAEAPAVPGAVADFLRRHNLPQRVCMGADARLAAMPWNAQAQMQVDTGRAGRGDVTSITHALAAVAETATMVMPSGADNPVTLSFLPENNVIVVARGDIVGTLEEVWKRLGDARKGALPRTLNLISGPSRSADIGGIPVLGAHGPKRLCVVVVG